MLNIRHLPYLVSEGIPKHEGKNSNKKEAQSEHNRFALLLRNPFTCFSDGIIQHPAGFAHLFVHG